MESEGPFDDRRFDLACCAALVVITWWVYAPSLAYDFVTMDDYPYVVENEAIQQGLGLDTFRWAFTTFHAASWFPLTWLSFAVDHAVGGLDPAVYHRTNLLWHVASAVLLYLALVRLSIARLVSALVTSVFALHPVHVESVAWVAERKDVLSAFFFAATLWAYAHYAARPSGARYTLVFGALALGLLAKSSLVTLPFVLVLLDVWPLEREGASWKRLVVEKLPLFALAAGAAALTYAAGASSEALEGEAGLGFGHRLANAAIAYTSYVRDTFWPGDLSPFYPHPRAAVSLPLGVASGLVIGVVSVGLMLRRNLAPQAWVGWFWFLGMLVPMIGLVQAGPQARADRFVHLPQIGLAIAVLGSIPRRAFESKRAWVATAAVGMVAILLMAMATRTRLPIWRDGRSLFEHVVTRTPDSAFAQHGLGQGHLRSGGFEEAEPAFRRAIELAPRWVAPKVGLALSLAEQGQERKATSWYERAAELAPTDLGLRVELAQRLMGEGAFERARPHLEFVAAHAAPDAAARAQVALGKTSERAGALDAARKHYGKAIALDAGFAAPHLALASLSKRSGNSAAALDSLREAARAESDSLVANNNLAWQLATADNATALQLEEARRHAERAVAASQRGEPSVLETLAVVQAAQGENAAARATLDEALGLVEARGDNVALKRELLRRRRGLPPANEGTRE
jgi:tetratricopeptide (TPR) repeat protein